MRNFLIPWVVMACLALPANLFALEGTRTGTDKGPLTIDAGLLHSDNNKEFRPKLTLDYRRDSFASWDEKPATMGSYYLEADARARFVHVWGENLNNEPSLVKLKLGFLWNMSGMKERENLPGSVPGALPAAPPVGDGDFVPVPGPAPGDYNYGKMGLKASAMAETDDHAENTNLTAGVEWAYSAVGAFQELTVPLPSAWLALDCVSPQSADARKALKVSTSAFPRFRGALLWNWDFGADLLGHSRIGKQLAFQAHYRYAKEFDQDDAWKDRGFDDYDQLNLKFTYRFEWPHVQKLGLRDLYAGYTSGRAIAHEKNDQRVYLGVTLQ